MRFVLPLALGALSLLAPAACPAASASQQREGAASASRADVRASAAPEPISAVVLFAGLAGVGALVARRRVIAARFASGR